MKDRIENGEVSVSYFPTLSMLADFYTKAVQGGLFTKIRNVLMGYESIDTLLKPTVSAFEERVGKDKEIANTKK